MKISTNFLSFVIVCVLSLLQCHNFLVGTFTLVKEAQVKEDIFTKLYSSTLKEVNIKSYETSRYFSLFVLDIY